MLVWEYCGNSFKSKVMVPCGNKPVEAVEVQREGIAKTVLISYMTDSLSVEFAVKQDKEKLKGINNANCILHMNPKKLDWLYAEQLVDSLTTKERFFVKCTLPFLFEKNFKLFFLNTGKENAAAEWIHVVYFKLKEVEL